jgi:hypothetical protein
MFQSWISDTCICFSLLDKNVFPLKSLVLRCFQREEVDRSTTLHLYCIERWAGAFGRVGRCGLKSTLENIQSQYLMAY